MSISIKLISRKLSFLSPVQPTIFSRKHVLLLHRRCLTSQTESSYLHKSAEVRCLTGAPLKSAYFEENEPGSQSECICFTQPDKNYLPGLGGQLLLTAAVKQCTPTCELINANNFDLDKSMRLSARPCLLTSDDIVLRDNYLTYNTHSHSDVSYKLQYSSVKQMKTNEKDFTGRPSDEQLLNVRESLAKSLPNLFVGSIDYGIYHKEIVFVNNIRGTTTNNYGKLLKNDQITPEVNHGKILIGLSAYIRQISLLRAMGHFKFAFVRFEVLKITSHPDDCTIRVRWRIRGIPGYMVVWNLVRYRIWRPSELIKNHQDMWIDGFSTYFVGGNGQIYKHVADKVMPDDNPVLTEPKTTPLAPKLAALFVGLAVGSKDSILSSSSSEFES